MQQSFFRWSFIRRFLDLAQFMFRNLEAVCVWNTVYDDQTSREQLRTQSDFLFRDLRILYMILS